MYTPNAAQLRQVDLSFHYHPPQGNQAERYGRIRSQAGALAMVLVTTCPRSRELSLAMTKLEEAVMHANAAIARNEVWDGNRMLSPEELEHRPGLDPC